MASEKTEIAILKTQMENLKESVDKGFKSINDKLEENSHQHAEMFKAFQSAMERKAGKWVESVILSVAGIIAIAFLGLIIYKVFGVALNL